jgi:hypothetical protein
MTRDQSTATSTDVMSRPWSVLFHTPALAGPIGRTCPRTRGYVS